MSPVLPGSDALPPAHISGPLNGNFHGWNQDATVAARPLGCNPWVWLVVEDH
jgi:hypothetical protein